MKQKRFLSMFALLLMAATGAWAQSAFTAKEITSASQLTSTDDQAYVAACMPSDFLAVDADVAKAWTGAPDGLAFLIYAIDGDKIKMARFLNGSNNATFGETWTIANFKIQLPNAKFFYTAATTYSVTLAEGTEDGDKWTISPTEAAEGDKVTVTYSGEKKVKSVKAVKKGVDPAKAYLTWDADQKQLVATEIPTTAIKVENANVDVSWAGTYVVEDDVTINGMIRLQGDVDLIIKDGAKLTAKQIIGSGNNLSIYGQANQTGELVVDYNNGDAIMGIPTLEVHSAKLTAASSSPNCGGIYGITTFNVYGGSVDAKGTGSGYGISLNSGGSMNIHGGEVKAEGKGTGSYSYGIRCGNPATVTVSGGKLWAGNADKKALNNINLQKGEGFTGKIEYSSDKSTWSETVDANAKYVRAGY